MIRSTAERPIQSGPLPAGSRVGGAKDSVKAVLFDLDDTLYSEAAYVHSGFAAVAAFLAPRLQTQATTLAARLDALHQRDGRGRLFDTLLAEQGVVDPNNILALASVVAYRTHVPQLTPFWQVVPVLDQLRAARIKIGVVSDGLASVQRTKLRAMTELVARLDAIVLTDELGPEYHKPSPVPFRVACVLLGVEPADAAYVGNDPRKDFTGARAAGLRTIRVGEWPDEGGTQISDYFIDDADEQISPFAALPAALGLACPRR